MQIFLKIFNLCSINSISTEVENLETLKQNTNQELLFFESIIDIETFIFLIGTNRLSESIITNLVEAFTFPIQISLKNIIPAKKEEDLEIKRFTDFERKKLENLLSNLSNFSKSVSVLNEPQLSKSLEFRNNYFLNDKSQIAKFLYLKNLKKIKKILKFSSNEELLSILGIEDLAVKRLKFRKMFEEFSKAIMHSENMHKIIKNEKENFLNLFLYRNEVNLKEYKKIRMIINLGGPFILPSLLFHLHENLLEKNREEFLHKLLLKILKPIENLKLEIMHRSTNEKKSIILNFLEETIKNSNLFSEAFESRSNLLQIYFKEDLNKIGKIDFYQEIMLKKYIIMLKKYDAEFFDKFIILNKEVINTYEEFLNTGQLQFKDSLKEFFDDI